MNLNIINQDFDISKIPTMSKKLDSIFHANEDVDKTAFLNWRTNSACTSREQFLVLGDAFFSTAYHLMGQCLLDNRDKKADSWIFPILFNIIHGVEVFLKAINVSLSLVLNRKRSISEGGHDLRTLCGNTKKLIIEYKKYQPNRTTEEMLEGIQLVQKFIENIYKKTDDMTFTRYPLDKNKKGHFYIQNIKNEVVDLELLLEQVVYVYNMLNFIYRYSMPDY